MDEVDRLVLIVWSNLRFYYLKIYIGRFVLFRGLWIKELTKVVAQRRLDAKYVVNYEIRHENIRQSKSN